MQLNQMSLTAFTPAIASVSPNMLQRFLDVVGPSSDPFVFAALYKTIHDIVSCKTFTSRTQTAPLAHAPLFVSDMHYHISEMAASNWTWFKTMRAENIERIREVFEEASNLSPLIKYSLPDNTEFFAVTPKLEDYKDIIPTSLLNLYSVVASAVQWRETQGYEPDQDSLDIMHALTCSQVQTMSNGQVFLYRSTTAMIPEKEFDNTLSNSIGSAIRSLIEYVGGLSGSAKEVALSNGVVAISGYASAVKNLAADGLVVKSFEPREIKFIGTDEAETADDGFHNFELASLLQLPAQCMVQIIDGAIMFALPHRTAVRPAVASRWSAPGARFQPQNGQDEQGQELRYGNAVSAVEAAPGTVGEDGIMPVKQPGEGSSL